VAGVATEVLEGAESLAGALAEALGGEGGGDVGAAGMELVDPASVKEEVKVEESSAEANGTIFKRISDIFKPNGTAEKSAENVEDKEVETNKDAVSKVPTDSESKGSTALESESVEEKKEETEVEKKEETSDEPLAKIMFTDPTATSKLGEMQGDPGQSNPEDRDLYTTRG